MEVGAAPKERNIEVQSEPSGTRIFMPARSAGELMGRLLVVICLKPLSKTLGVAIRWRAARACLISAPSEPSMALNSCWRSWKAKPMPLSAVWGTRIDMIRPEIDSIWIAPARTWASMSASVPSCELG